VASWRDKVCAVSHCLPTNFDGRSSGLRPKFKLANLLRNLFQFCDYISAILRWRKVVQGKVKVIRSFSPKFEPCVDPCKGDGRVETRLLGKSFRVVRACVPPSSFPTLLRLQLFVRWHEHQLVCRHAKGWCSTGAHPG